MTVKITNSGDAAGTLDLVLITLPTVAAGVPVYVPNSTSYEGNREGDPDNEDSGLVFRTPRDVAPGQSVTLEFKIYIPSAPDSYLFEASGRSRAEVVDSTEDPNDQAPASTTVVQTGDLPAPSGFNIIGRVLNENGEGMPYVVVYLYRGAGISAFDAEYSVNNEYGTLSAITDLDGTYAFRDIPRGTYRVEPNFTGLTFFPNDVRVASGFFAPVITAVAQDLHHGGCETFRRAEAIVRSDDIAREGVFLGLQLAKFYLAQASEMLQGPARAQALHELTRASGQLQRSYTRILNTSELLPKLELQCSNKPGCRTASFGSALKRYRAQLNILRKLAFFVVRTSRLAGLPEGGAKWSLLASRIRKTHTASIAVWRSLPRQSDICDHD